MSLATKIAEGAMKSVSKKKKEEEEPEESSEHTHSMHIEKVEGGYVTSHNGKKTAHKSHAAMVKHVKSTMCADDDCEPEEDNGY